jgi:hypothetical protein
MRDYYINKFRSCKNGKLMNNFLQSKGQINLKDTKSSDLTDKLKLLHRI